MMPVQDSLVAWEDNNEKNFAKWLPKGWQSFCCDKKSWKVFIGCRKDYLIITLDIWPSISPSISPFVLTHTVTVQNLLVITTMHKFSQSCGSPPTSSYHLLSTSHSHGAPDAPSLLTIACSARKHAASRAVNKATTAIKNCEHSTHINA